MVPSSNLVQLIKRIALEAVEAAKPCDYRIGTVISTDPVKIKVSQKVELEEEFLHFVQGTPPELLLVGDRVFMMRKAGGQEYTIIDKVVK